MELMMSDFPFARLVLTIAALGSGIIGGTFFAFSTFVMASLAEISGESGVAAMSAINRVILRSWFMPVFVGTAVLSVLIIVLAMRNWDFSASSLMIVGATLYLVASFLSTIVFNVPLNDRLATFDGQGAEAASFWTTYFKDWTFWNHVRTAASLLASAAFIVAIR
jgi:uncharacterized membrane protein